MTTTTTTTTRDLFGAPRCHGPTLGLWSGCSERSSRTTPQTVEEVQLDGCLVDPRHVKTFFEAVLLLEPNNNSRRELSLFRAFRPRSGP